MNQGTRKMQGPMAHGGKMPSKPLRAPPVGTGGKPRPHCPVHGTEMLLEYRPGRSPKHRCDDCPDKDEQALVRPSPGPAPAGSARYYVGAYVPGQLRTGPCTWALTDIDIRNPAFASLLPDGYLHINGLHQSNMPRAIYNDLQSAQMAVRVADSVYQSHAPWMVVPVGGAPSVPAAASGTPARSGTPAPLAAVSGYCIAAGGVGGFITPGDVSLLGFGPPKSAPPPAGSSQTSAIALYTHARNARAVAAAAAARFPMSAPFTVVPYAPPVAAVQPQANYP